MSEFYRPIVDRVKVGQTGLVPCVLYPGYNIDHTAGQAVRREKDALQKHVGALISEQWGLLVDREESEPGGFVVTTVSQGESYRNSGLLVDRFVAFGSLKPPTTFASIDYQGSTLARGNAERMTLEEHVLLLHEHDMYRDAMSGGAPDVERYLGDQRRYAAEMQSFVPELGAGVSER